MVNNLRYICLASYENNFPNKTALLTIFVRSFWMSLRAQSSDFPTRLGLLMEAVSLRLLLNWLQQSNWLPK
jgi:hypothetical protein